MNTRTDGDTSLRPAWRPFLWIVLASALAHIWCLGSQFYMDDFPQIHRNENIHNGIFWNSFGLLWTRLGLVIQYKLFGLSPVGYHAVNWILHTATACTLFACARAFLKDTRYQKAALFAALLFAVHPLGSEIPNYARTQDLAWVTLFSLLGCCFLLRSLHGGSLWNLLWTALAILGASMSKGPGIFHALMTVGTVAIASMAAPHWTFLRRKGWWIITLFVIALGALWFSGIGGNFTHVRNTWENPRFIGHGYTLTRVFWEFSSRAFVPVSLCSDHHITETLFPPGSSLFSIPDQTALWSAAAMLALTLLSLGLLWRKPTRLFGACLFLFTATILFRIAYLMPEFMPEYRIYPGLPWFCLGIAILLTALWSRLVPRLNPRIPATIILLIFIILSARRSFVWHSLDTLCSDVLRQYPARARAIWELHDQDVRNKNWQSIIDRQRSLWPPTFKSFLSENRKLSPARALPTGHFALADVACSGRYAIALANTGQTEPALRELHRMSLQMKQLGMTPESHRIHFVYQLKSQARVLEDIGKPDAALAFMKISPIKCFSPAEIQRLETRIKRSDPSPKSPAP